MMGLVLDWVFLYLFTSDLLTDPPLIRFFSDAQGGCVYAPPERYPLLWDALFACSGSTIPPVQRHRGWSYDALQS